MSVAFFKIINKKTATTIFSFLCVWTTLLVATTQASAQSFTSKSSGIIRVYFTNTVDNSISPYADGMYNPHMEDTIVAYINKAHHTLDMCVYDNRSDAIISAVNQAYIRGVTVRFISETTALNYSLAGLNPSVALLKRNDGTNIMHNKFVIIDRDEENNAWVITGSANHTPDNLTIDPNNVVFIQDKQLALAYTTEFEEMWGSATATPNLSNSKFGDAKTDNTPHTFTIGGKTVELYFSPSDGTSTHIETAVNTTDSDFCFAMFTFIHNGIGDAVEDVHNSGVAVKGIIENVSYFGSEYNSLLSAGIPVLSHENVPNSFHHKYGVADATSPSSDPLVVTGSHNWTNSAEEDYDENTLIIHDGQIAAMYFEEFMTRFNELSLGTPETISEDGIFYFDPAKRSLIICGKHDGSENLVDLFDLTGRTIFKKKIPNINESPLEITLPEDMPGLFIAKISSRCHTGIIKIFLP
ncbi:MAG TPA: phospholipase D-like domain-containing protein [Bacteroidales bacterium]|nr:hypothetical protein [Bacteroidales bacterium]HPI29465.1 phospholipase D-like domain-containing protein [Bacteroidales bacterium]